MQFAVEHYADVAEEIKGLIALHWEEIALYKDKIKLAPDWAKYEQLERNGILHIITARRDQGELVGYHISIVAPHLHYAETLMCITDIFFLKPEYRQGMAGIRLIKFVEEEMRKRGVKKLVMGYKIHHNLGPIFKRLGWDETDHLCAKWIGD